MPQKNAAGWPAPRVANQRPFIRALALFFVFLAAGCAGAPATPSPTSDSPTEAFELSTDATGCTRVFPAIFVDRDHAQSFLPDGFVAAEASRFFGQGDRPAGTGILVVSSMRCQSSELDPDGYSEAMAGIFVEPPAIAGEWEGEHFYDLGRVWGDEDALASTLATREWPRLGTDVEVVGSSAPVHSGSAIVSDAQGEVFSVEVAAAPAADEFSGTFHIRWWNLSERGIGFFEYEFTPDGYLGPGTCRARTGSVVANVMESPECQDALLMVGPSFDVAGRFAFESAS